MNTPNLHDFKVEFVSVDTPKPDPNNPRSHSDDHIDQIQRSMVAFGYINPIIIDGDDNIIAGHGRLEAAKRSGLKTIPIIRVKNLTPTQIIAYRMADNKLTDNSHFDDGLLRANLAALEGADLDFEITDTGFSNAEIDLILGDGALAGDDSSSEMVDEDLEGPVITKRGDLFRCGDHRILCGDSTRAADYAALMRGELAAASITDPPYNLNIPGVVSGLGSRTHENFVQGCGEMSFDGFIAFLEQAYGLIAANLAKGALAYVFMDWRHLAEALAAGKISFHELINLCVWAKTNGGMGSLYRSAHELVLVFKASRGKHQNNVQMGRHGRNRTNIWRYQGVNSFGKGRDDALAMHPTVKPIALIADAILDCTKRKDLVLDPFAGSGTILIAAHRTGRRARAMELDPKYVDVCLRRYRRVIGTDPIHMESGLTLTQMEQQPQDKEPVR